MSIVHLDHNATTPVAPEVAEAMWPYLTEHYGNPSSGSAAGRVARRAVETAREQVADLIGARPDEITFTSGGTESNNLAIRGLAEAAPSDAPRVAFTSALEHPATVQPLTLLARDGWEVTALATTGDGRVDLDTNPITGLRFGSVILAQNETGALQPVREFAEWVHGLGGLVHTDAAQAVGKVEVDVDALGVDLLSVAGHKLYAPKGVGALYVRRSTSLAPLLVGAGQERGLRPGTENVASIVGLGCAAALARSRQCEDAARIGALRDRLWHELQGAVPRLVRITPMADCLPNTLMISLPGRLGRDVLAAAPNVEASTGSACHAGVDSPSATLVAMGVSEDVALGAVRLSLGRSTRQADVETAVRDLSAALLGD